jgi:hypothetical protein
MHMDVADHDDTKWRDTYAQLTNPSILLEEAKRKQSLSMQPLKLTCNRELCLRIGLVQRMCSEISSERSTHASLLARGRKSNM